MLNNVVASATWIKELNVVKAKKKEYKILFAGSDLSTAGVARVFYKSCVATWLFSIHDIDAEATLLA